MVELLFLEDISYQELEEICSVPMWRFFIVLSPDSLRSISRVCGLRWWCHCDSQEYFTKDLAVLNLKTYMPSKNFVVLHLVISEYFLCKIYLYITVNHLFIQVLKRVE